MKRTLLAAVAAAAVLAFATGCSSPSLPGQSTGQSAASTKAPSATGSSSVAAGAVDPDVSYIPQLYATVAAKYPNGTDSGMLDLCKSAHIDKQVREVFPSATMEDPFNGPDLNGNGCLFVAGEGERIVVVFGVGGTDSTDWQAMKSYCSAPGQPPQETFKIGLSACGGQDGVVATDANVTVRISVELLPSKDAAIPEQMLVNAMANSSQIKAAYDASFGQAIGD